MVSAAKEELKRVLEQLSEEESRLVLKFAQWLADQEEELTQEELALLQRGEEQFAKGEFAWWKDVKRTKV
jgi:hypothetical protein